MRKTKLPVRAQRRQAEGEDLADPNKRTKVFSPLSVLSQACRLRSAAAKSAQGEGGSGRAAGRQTCHRRGFACWFAAAHQALQAPADEFHPTTIYVGDFPLGTDDRDLERLFGPVGPVESIRLIPGKK